MLKRSFLIRGFCGSCEDSRLAFDKLAIKEHDPAENLTKKSNYIPVAAELLVLQHHHLTQWFPIADLTNLVKSSQDII